MTDRPHHRFKVEAVADFGVLTLETFALSKHPNPSALAISVALTPQGP
jgi:hypothetical protein